MAGDGEFGDKWLGELMGKFIGSDLGILIYIFGRAEGIGMITMKGWKGGKGN